MSIAPEAELDALTRAVLAVFRAHQAIVADGDRLAGGWQLNSAKWKTLGAIALAGAPITAPAIGRAMGLSRQGAQKQLDALVKAALVVRLANDADARAPLYRLTARGQSVYDQLVAAWRARSAQLAQGIDEKALAGAARTLHDIADAIAARPQRAARARGRKQ